MPRFAGCLLFAKGNIQRPEIDFRYTPNNGHPSADVGFRADFV
jgi:hypothetical protein